MNKEMMFCFILVVLYLHNIKIHLGMYMNIHNTFHTVMHIAL